MRVGQEPIRTTAERACPCEGAGLHRGPVYSYSYAGPVNPDAVMSASAAATWRSTATKLSGVAVIESMPQRTRKPANSA